MATYASLERIQAKEDVMNSHLFENRVGHPVLFGEAIQLRHITSGKFLAVSRTETAVTEPENFRIFLSAAHTQSCWFKMTPALPINQDGDQIGNMSAVILSPLLCPEEVVHVSSKMMEHHTLRRQSVSALNLDVLSTNVAVREINTSFTRTAFKVMLFSEYFEKSCLKVGDLVYIEDPDGKSCMRPAKPQEAMAMPKAMDQQGSASDPTEDGGPDRGRLPVHFHDAHTHVDREREVTFSPVVTHFDQSSAIWVIERAQYDLGGPILWHQQYTLRHLKTGKMLCSGRGEEGSPPQGLPDSPGMMIVDAGLNGMHDLSERNMSTVVSFAPASASALRKQDNADRVHDLCAGFLRFNQHLWAAQGDEFLVDNETVGDGGKMQDEGTGGTGQERRSAALKTTVHKRAELRAHREDAKALVIRRVPLDSPQHSVLCGLHARAPLRKMLSDLKSGYLQAFDGDSVKMASILDQLRHVSPQQLSHATLPPANPPPSSSLQRLHRQRQLQRPALSREAEPQHQADPRPAGHAAGAGHPGPRSWRPAGAAGEE